MAKAKQKMDFNKKSSQSVGVDSRGVWAVLDGYSNRVDEDDWTKKAPADNTETGTYQPSHKRNVFMLNGRWNNYVWQLDKNGLMLLGDFETSVKNSDFHWCAGGNGWTKFEFDKETGKVVYWGDNDVDDESGATVKTAWDAVLNDYYRDLAVGAKRALPEAEAVIIYNHVVRKSSWLEGQTPETQQTNIKEKDKKQMPKLVTKINPEAEQNGDEETKKLHNAAQQMVSGFNYFQYFPAYYKKRAAQQLHRDQHGGVKQYVQDVASATCQSKVVNQYALLPNASEDEKQKLIKILEEDSYYDYINVSKCMFEDKFICDLEVSQWRGLFDLAGSVIKGAGTKLLHLLGPYQHHWVAKPIYYLMLMWESTGAAQAVQPVALAVHTDGSMDYFNKSSMGIMEWGFKEGLPKPGKQRRILTMNMWRSIWISPDDEPIPIRNHHLAVLDTSTVEQKDIVLSDLVFRGFPIEQYKLNWKGSQEAQKKPGNLNLLKQVNDTDRSGNGCKLQLSSEEVEGILKEQRHRWVYFPDMIPSEVLIFKQCDTNMYNSVDKGLGMHKNPETFHQQTGFHTAFVDESAPPDINSRESCEARMVVVFPEEDLTVDSWIELKSAVSVDKTHLFKVAEL